MSVGLAGDILCVVNKDQDPGHPGLFLPNYTSFRVTAQGQLTPIPNSTVSVDLGSSPSQALLSPDGSLMFGADFLGGLLRSFRISANGRLTPADALPLPPAEFADTGAPPLPLGPGGPSRRSRSSTSASSRSTGSASIATTTREASTSCGPCPTRATASAGSLVNKAGDAALRQQHRRPERLGLRHQPRPDRADRDPEGEPQRRTGNGGFQFALDSTGSFLHVVTQQSSPTSDVTANALHVFSVGGRRHADRGPVLADPPARAQPGPPAGRGGALYDRTSVPGAGRRTSATRRGWAAARPAVVCQR